MPPEHMINNKSYTRFVIVTGLVPTIADGKYAEVVAAETIGNSFVRTEKFYLISSHSGGAIPQITGMSEF
jgi:hypothetical protein